MRTLYQILHLPEEEKQAKDGCSTFNQVQII